MPTTLTCTSCRSPIDVPADHDADTIHCGICWTAVPVPKAAPAPVLRPVAAAPPVAPLVKPRAADANGSGAARPTGVQVAAALPPGAKPAAGMARLEALLHTAGTRLKAAAPAGGSKASAVLPSAILISVQAPAPAPAPAPAAAEPPAVEIVEPEIVAEVPAIAPVVRPAAAIPAVAPAAPPVISPSTAGRPKTGRRVEDDEPDRKKSRYRRRDEDDEDDDRGPRRRESKGGAVVFALVAAGVLVVGLGVGAFFLIRALAGEDKPDVANNPGGQPGNNFNPVPNPNPLPQFKVPDPDPAPIPNNPAPGAPNNPFPNPNNPFPNPFPKNPAEAPLVWKRVAGADGFQAEMPGDARPEDHWKHVHHSDGLAKGKPPFVKADGKKYEVRAGGHHFAVEFVDIPDGFPPDPKHVLTPFKKEAVVAARFAGHQGYEFTEQWGTSTTVRKLVQVGCRMFVFHAQTSPGFGRDPQEADAARKKFFDSVQITFDPNTPAPANPLAPRPNRPARPNRPGGPGLGNPPGENPGEGGDPFPNPARELTAAARLDPFWTAVVLPDRNEVLAFAARVTAAGRPGGVLRRYTYPGFVPKNTYHLPHPVTYAVADEKAGKLLVATATKPDAIQRESERQVHVGDVQLYDLKPIFDGSVAERDDLKPAGTIPFGGRIAGLELAGGSAFVLSVAAQPGNKAKPWRTKLTRLDPETGKSLGELDLPDPAWRLRANAAGSRLYVTEAQLTPAGLPIWGAARNGYVLVVDAKAWRREKTLSVPGVAFDLAVRPDGTLLASVSQGGGVKLYAVPDSGQTTELDPAAGGPASLGYAALTPDGKRMVTAPPRDFGVAVYDVTNLDGPAGLKKAADARAVKLPKGGDAEAPIGGHFVLTPDGRYALFQVGLVLDLAKPAG